MLEPWDEVLALQKERNLCAEDVEVIKTSCLKEHNKTHVAECPECWSRLLNRMRDRYLNSATKEWFSGRRLFLQELDTLFAQSHEQKTDLKTIEERIFEEKKEWFRDKVRNLGLQSATNSLTEARSLQQKMNDRSIPADQLALELREAFSDGTVDNEEAFNNFLDRLKAAKSPQARNEVYVDVFFQPGRDSEGAAKSQKYIEMVRNGTSVAEVISIMLRDRQSNKGSQEQKLALQKKVEELRRAKAAHAADKAKKAKIRQDKANAAVAAEQQQEYNFPPCWVCKKLVNTDDFIACPACLVLFEKYRILEDGPKVFCSEPCYNRGFDIHQKEAHPCASGQGCVSIQDEDMEMEDARQCFCLECVLDLEIESLFCSPRCLDINFQRHREEIHLPKREHMGEIGDDEKDLEYAQEDKSSYRARKIVEHFILLDDTMQEYVQKMGATVL